MGFLFELSDWDVLFDDSDDVVILISAVSVLLGVPLAPRHEEEVVAVVVVTATAVVVFALQLYAIVLMSLLRLVLDCVGAIVTKALTRKRRSSLEAATCGIE